MDWDTYVLAEGREMVARLLLDEGKGTEADIFPMSIILLLRVASMQSQIIIV